MAITGVPLGGSGVFGESPTPAGSAFPAGTKFSWSADDPNVVLTPSADGTQVTAAVPASDPATSFTLAFLTDFTPQGDTAPVQAVASVPILPAVIPTPTGAVINQLS